jgi:hypothetical protein
MSTGETRGKAQNRPQTVKAILVSAAANLLADGIAWLAGRNLYRDSEWFRELLRRFSHSPLAVLIALSLLSLLLLLAYAMPRLGVPAGKPWGTSKTFWRLTGIAGLLGLMGLTAIATAFTLSRNTPFEKIVMDTDTVHNDTSFVLNRDLSGLLITVSVDYQGIPQVISVELDRYTPLDNDRELLEIKGLEPDTAIRQSAYFKLRPGDFRVPGAFKAGDRLELRTKRTSGFEGIIIVAFWVLPQEGAGK